ncbi:MAG: hypothetical protein GXP26_02050 [Planctomycetes bacterium]|nr:hypothetical protein [Planctomycetota bacterium]
MLATRLPMIFGRTSVWLAVAVLLFPGATFAQCSCSDGGADVSLRQDVSACCCQEASATDSCCVELDASVPSCCSSAGTGCDGSGCNCGCSQEDSPQSQEPFQSASSSNPLEQVVLGLADLATARCYSSGSLFQANPNQFQQVTPVTALQRCIALSRFTC